MVYLLNEKICITGGKQLFQKLQILHFQIANVLAHLDISM